MGHVHAICTIADTETETDTVKAFCREPLLWSFRLARQHSSLPRAKRRRGLTNSCVWVEHEWKPSSVCQYR
jgi:hypothetical protein